MKLSIQTNETLVGGVSETAAFKVEMNAMMFHSIIDGIYADKIRSPFRELCTNARDSHAEHGNLDRPFDVWLPSQINPVFKVRDYGTGLSHEDVMGLYTTMFASSKRDSNDVVGMIGLGSKSPFAYTSAFTVTSIFGGKETVYSAFIGDAGIPQIAVMNVKDSNLDTGIEISMPVQTKDIETFRRAANDVLFAFDPFPNIINEQWSRMTPVIASQGDGWTMYQSGAFFTAPVARQGCVIYPINTAALGVPALSAYMQDTDPNRFWKWPVMIDFDIGELDVATSREALGYTPKTIAALKAKIEAVRVDMSRSLQVQIEHCKSYLEACKIYSAGMRQGPSREMWGVLGRHVTYGGRGLSTSFNIQSVRKDKWEAMVIHPSYVPAGVIRTTMKFSPKNLHLVSFVPQDVENMLVAVEAEEIQGVGSRVRKLIADNPKDKPRIIVWVRPKDQQALDEFIDSFAFEGQVIDLKTVDKLASPRTTLGKDVKRLRYLNVSNNHGHAYLPAKYEATLLGPSITYLEQKENRFILAGKEVDISTLWQAFINCQVHNALPGGFKVHLLNQTHKDLDRKALGMVPFESKVRAELLKRTDLMDIARYSISGQKRQKITFATTFIKALEATKVAVPRDMAKFFMQVAQDTTVNGTSTSLYNFCRQFISDDLDKMLIGVDPLYFEFDEWMTKYPLLKHAVLDPLSFSHYMELIQK